LRRTLSILAIGLLFAGCGKKAEDQPKDVASVDQKPAVTVFDGEKHFKNVKQLTFGGENAEAYFSYDGKELIFQSTRDGRSCDAIYRMNADGSDVRMVSSGKGATTCSFIAPDGQSIIYSSTQLGGDACPPKPDMSRGYVWALYKDYDIYRANPDGSNPVRLTTTPGYDAEAVYSPLGNKIIFTSARTGDLELFTMNPDGTDVEQITNTPGYDGGAFFSLDGQWICWRASRPTGDALKDYRDFKIGSFLFDDNADELIERGITSLTTESDVPIHTHYLHQMDFTQDQDGTFHKKLTPHILKDQKF